MKDEILRKELIMNILFASSAVSLIIINGYRLSKSKSSFSFIGIFAVLMLVFTGTSVVSMFMLGSTVVDLYPINIIFICSAFDNVFNRRVSDATAPIVICFLILFVFALPQFSGLTALNASLLMSISNVNSRLHKEKKLHLRVYYGILALLGVMLICVLYVTFSSSLGDFKDGLCHLKLSFMD